MWKRNILACFFIIAFSISGNSDDNLDEIFYNPNGFNLPDKSQFSLVGEKIITLGGGIVKDIIEREYNYIGPDENYRYFIERFAGECVFLDEFYRFLISGYRVYILKKNNIEKILFYDIGNLAQGRAYCSDDYSSTEIGYGFSIWLSDYNFDGVFDRLHLLGIDSLDDIKNAGIEYTEDSFPYRCSFIQLLKFFDLKFLNDNKK
jgi:hypothetical protein